MYILKSTSIKVRKAISCVQFQIKEKRHLFILTVWLQQVIKIALYDHGFITKFGVVIQ